MHNGLQHTERTMQPLSVFVAALVFASTLNVGRADLPVHCLRHQIAGEWEFTLGPLGPKRNACGHTSPDNPYKQPHVEFLEKEGHLTKRKFTLHNPNTVSAEDGSSGTWTMIYDEAFEVATGGFVYLAFSKFVFEDPGMQRNISKCGETQIGWYHDVTRSRWGCYYGKKTAPAASVLQGAPVMALNSFGSALDSGLAPVKSQKSGASFLTTWLDSADKLSSSQDEGNSATIASSSPQQQDKESQDILVTPPDYEPWVPKSAGYDQPMEGTWQKSVAVALNFLQLGWTASAYDQFQGKTPRELNSFAGVRRTRIPAAVQKESAKALKRHETSFTSFLGLESKVTHASFEEEDFDWRSKDGKNWVTPVVTQGDCGSCYTIATVHMLTARNKIRSGSLSEPSFAVSFPLYCSEYNQGCDGGYGFLQSKWTEDVGLVPEHCAPFSQGGGSCRITPSCDLGAKRYRATHHHYVGGYYGASDADSIRKELVERGPVVMSFEPSEDFMYYKSGVYRSGPHKIHQEWEQVDHAVLLMGYGMDKNAPYWTMQNSWGSDWGEDGYFRMARGIDESGCESIVVAAEVVEESSNSVLDEFVAAKRMTFHPSP